MRVADPYRRLEDETPAVLAWQQVLDQRAQGALSVLPWRERLERQVAEHLSAARVSLPQPVAGRVFRALPDARGAIAAVEVGDRLLGGATATVVHAGRGPLAGEEAIAWFAPSPDGRLLAVGSCSDGDEQMRLVLVDAASGEAVGPPVRHVMREATAWLPDASALYCALGRGGDHAAPLKRLARIEPGAGAVEVAAPPQAADHYARVQVAHDGRHVALAAGIAGQLIGVHACDGGGWTPALGLDDGERFLGVFHAGEYVAVTTLGAARGRLVAAPLDALADPARWRELLPEGTAVMRDVGCVAGDLLLCELDDGVVRLSRVTGTGEVRAVLAPPPGLTIAAPHGMPPLTAVGEEVLLLASAVDRSPALWRWSSATGELCELTPPRRQLPGVRRRPPDARRGRLRAAHARVADAYVVVEREDVPAGPRPTLLHGYGGFDVAAFPTAFAPLAVPWILAGGRYVHAHLPGDGTFGSAQWRGGRRASKQRTFDALLAVAEELVACELTSPDRLALFGASNGGLLAAAALTQRPELFAAVAVLTPFCDMLRYRRDRFAERLGLEYGDPALPEQARWLSAYSPAHNVPRGRPLPATIVVCAERDMRTPPWHGRKLAAALLDAGADPADVLLRVHAGRGHADAVFEEAATIAEWLGFLMARTGLEPVD